MSKEYYYQNTMSVDGMTCSEDAKDMLYPDDCEKDEQKCRVCGCTWNNACEGGCYWVESDLCSKCVDKE